MISLTFSSIKERNFEEARKKICATIQMLYQKYQFLLEGDILNGQEKAEFLKVSAEMPEYEATLTLKNFLVTWSAFIRKK